MPTYLSAARDVRNNGRRRADEATSPIVWRSSGWSRASSDAGPSQTGLLVSVPIADHKLMNYTMGPPTLSLQAPESLSGDAVKSRRVVLPPVIIIFRPMCFVRHYGNKLGRYKVSRSAAATEDRLMIPENPAEAVHQAGPAGGFGDRIGVDQAVTDEHRCVASNTVVVTMGALRLLSEHQELVAVTRDEERVLDGVQECHSMSSLKQVGQDKRAHPAIGSRDGTRGDVDMHLVPVEVRRIKCPIVERNAPIRARPGVRGQEPLIGERIDDGLTATSCSDEEIDVMREALGVPGVRECDALPEHHHERPWESAGEQHEGAALECPMICQNSSDPVERYSAVSVARQLGYDGTRAALAPNPTRHAELIEVEVRRSELPKQVREDPVIEESCSHLIAAC
jgi:hypothetical protein